jgi:hypothetical protein
MRLILAATTAMAAGALAASPALAQPRATVEPRVNQLIIYGDDKCPESNDGEIVVCARKEEEERYRIPEGLRTSASPSNEAWTNKVTAYETVGRTGTLSCSPTGAGGWTGCAGRLIDAAYAEKKTDPSLRFAELIAAERAKRLATIDAEADDTQKRVEVLEVEMEARRKAQEAADRGEDIPPEVLPPPK